MNNYEKLLEMDTDNDSNVQLQLYKECLAGAGEGPKEAMEWLKLAAENGNEEAISILDSINDKTNTPDDNVYSKMSMLDLLKIADYDYYAAKELYYNRSKNYSFDEKLTILNKIVSFDNAETIDYENLAKMYYFSLIEKYDKYYSIDKNQSKDFDEYITATIFACDNAIELGSKLARKYEANICLLLDKLKQSTAMLCEQVALEGNIYDKFLHFVAIKTGVVIPPKTTYYLQAWKEQIESNREFCNSKIGELYNSIKSDDDEAIEKIEDQLKQNCFSELETVVIQIALSMYYAHDIDKIIDLNYKSQYFLNLNYSLITYECYLKKKMNLEKKEEQKRQYEIWKAEKEKEKEEKRIKERKEMYELGRKTTKVRLIDFALTVFLGAFGVEDFYLKKDNEACGKIIVTFFPVLYIISCLFLNTYNKGVLVILCGIILFVYLISFGESVYRGLKHYRHYKEFKVVTNVEKVITICLFAVAIAIISWLIVSICSAL